MQDSIGAIDLQIARLQRQLNVLRQRRQLCQPYPEHLAQFTTIEHQVQNQLVQLSQHRQQIRL